MKTFYLNIKGEEGCLELRNLNFLIFSPCSSGLPKTMRYREVSLAEEGKTYLKNIREGRGGFEWG